MRILCGCFFRMRAGGTIDDFLKYKEKSAAKLKSWGVYKMMKKVIDAIEKYLKEKS